MVIDTLKTNWLLLEGNKPIARLGMRSKCMNVSMDIDEDGVHVAVWLNNAVG